MTFTNDSLFTQFYEVAEQFLEVVVSTMQWLFFEPFIAIQTWYWDAYSAINGSWLEDFLKPIYQYLAWASGAPTVYGDEISLGAFILTAGVAIWVFIRIIIFVFDILLKLIDCIGEFREKLP